MRSVDFGNLALNVRASLHFLLELLDLIFLSPSPDRIMKGIERKMAVYLAMCAAVRAKEGRAVYPPIGIMARTIRATSGRMIVRTTFTVYIEPGRVRRLIGAAEAQHRPLDDA